MQVTQTNEFITHAVISGTAQIDMGISNSAEFFQILSSTLYSDQMLAVVRETTCNAWDAHVESGCTDKPIQITVDTTKIVIRDFGHGIHRDLMGPIYGIYGASTKKNDGLQTGGFGLGCKAPFAYTDHFQVTSNHAGTKTIYSMSKSSAQVGGKPAIIPIASFPTEENGLEVSINIKREDMPRFLKLFQLIIRNGEMNAEINGEPAKTTPYSEAKNGFAILPTSPLADASADNKICVRYGNVIYPLSAHNDLIGYRVAVGLIDKLTKVNSYGQTGNTLILLAPPHSISVTPSRESLSMQEHTITTVNKLMEEFIDYMNQKDGHLESLLLKENIADATPDELIDFGVKLNKYSFSTDGWKSNNSLITDYSEYRRAVHSQERNYGLVKKDLLLRIKAADALNLFVKGKAHSLYRAIQRMPNVANVQTDWATKHIVNPLLRKMKLVPEMNAARLFFTSYTECEPVVTKEGLQYTCSVSQTAKHARPCVVLHYIRKDVTHRIQKEGTLQGENRRHVLFYHVPRIVAKVQSAIDFFTAQGYQVIDLTKPLAGETEEHVAPVLKVVKTSRPQGLIALSAASRDSVFKADKLYSDAAKRIDDPKCVFLCNNTEQQRGSNRLSGFESVSDTILNLYGDVAGVAKTGLQYDRYVDKGVKRGIDYVTADVINYVTESDLILQYLTAQRTMDAYRFTRRIYDYLLNSEVFCATYKLPYVFEPKDENYLLLWEDLKSKYNLPKMVDASKDVDSLPIHQGMLDVCNKIKNSKYYVFLAKDAYITQDQFDEHVHTFIDLINQ
jgi:hypothetical protein